MQQVTLHFIYYLFNLTTVIFPILYFISSLSNLNFCHFSTFHKDVPPPTLFELPYQQQKMGAVSLVDQDTWVFIFVMAMNDYVSNFPSKQMFLHCNYKISTLVLQIHIPFHIIDEDRNTHTTISFYMVDKHKNLTDQMCRTEIPPTKSVESPMHTTLCCPFFPKCYNARPYMTYVQCQSQKNENTV